MTAYITIIFSCCRWRHLNFCA